MKILITGGTGSLGVSLIKTFSRVENSEIVFTYYNNERRARELEKRFSCKGISLSNDYNLPNDFDVIINNAGVVNSLVVCEDIDLEKWEETLKVNLTLPFLIIKNNLPYMREKGFGRIINIASIYGVCAEEEVAPYCVSKHGLIGLTKSVAKEYGQYGISCNAICPGTMKSEMADRLADYYTSTPKEREEYFAQLIEAAPTRRLVEPEEVASLAYYLAVQDSGNINGAVLMVDGGYTA